jgi:uncharacterized protein (TIGR02996 family)
MALARLQKAEAAIDRGDDAAARDLLVAEWRTRRSPELAELVTLLASRAPDELAEQLAAVITPRVATSHAAFRRVIGADDPRLARWILDALANPPFCAISAEPFLHALVTELGALRDPRIVDELAAITAVLRARLTRKPIYERLCKQLARIATGLAPPKSPPAGERAVLASITAKLDRVKRPARTIEALLADVYAHPHDDAPRMVLADLLLERGDPRGEFIQLQLARGRDGEPSPHEALLVKLHGKRWLGPLATVLSFGKGYSSTRFERGFVAHADFIFKIEKKLALIVGAIEWATIETFERYAPIELFEHAPLHGLRSLRVGTEGLARVARRTTPLTGVTEVAAAWNLEVEPSTLRSLFPSLVRLELAHYPSADQLAAIVAAGITELAVDVWSPDESAEALATVQAAFVEVAARSALAVVSVRPPTRRPPLPEWVHYRRGADGGLVKT